MKYLVTGAAGFIGAHTAKKLSIDGHEVTAVDSLSDYYSRDLKILRVSALLDPIGIELTHLSLENQSEVNELLDENQFDSIIHLAAQPGVRVPQNEYSKYISSNLLAFSNILCAARQRDIPNFLYASSSSVYGNSPKALFSESETSIQPISFYGGTKLANEILANAGRKQSRTRSRGLRFFTVYGPWGRPDMAYFRILASLVDGYEFSMFGKGNVLRDFTYINDVTTSIMQLDAQLSEEDLGFADVVNVGGGNPSTLLEMIDVLERLVGKQISAKIEIENSNDVLRTCADAGYLISLIGKSPSTKLEDGLREVVEWAQSVDVQSKMRLWAESVV